MASDKPVKDIIAEIKSYNGKLVTEERIDDINILSEDLGEDYTVKYWLFHRQLRVAVIGKDGFQR